MQASSSSSRTMLSRKKKNSTLEYTVAVFLEKARNEKAYVWATHLLIYLRFLLAVLSYLFVILPMLKKMKTSASCHPYSWSTWLQHLKLGRITDLTKTFTCPLQFISALVLVCLGQALFWTFLREKTERVAYKSIHARLNYAAERGFLVQRTLLVTTLTALLPVYYSAQEIRTLRRECRSQRKLEEFSGEARKCYDKLSELTAEIAQNLAVDGIQ